MNAKSMCVTSFVIYSNMYICMYELELELEHERYFNELSTESKF